MIENVFILHHTHVDLGYTAPRQSVCDDLVAMVDQAIDLADRYADRSPAERFRWIHEVSWPVLEYLQKPNARSEKLFRHIRNGLMELTALYVNPTELFDQRSFERSIDRACTLARQNDLPLHSAMFSDCPGIAWSVVDMLADRGVKYLATAPDFIMSYPLDLERPFYWEGPNGGRLLTWFADWRNNWYGEGRQVFKMHMDPAWASNRLIQYIQQLHDEGYRWKGLAIHFGYDNQPPQPSIVDFVTYFNANHNDVQVRMATCSEFFSYMQTHHDSEFAVHKGAWPDWWANGHAAAAFETACSRKTKSHLERSAALADMIQKPLDTQRLELAEQNMILFDEHTWGHTTAACDPWSAVSRMEWNLKRNYAFAAVESANQLERNIAQAIEQDYHVVIANPFDTEWSGPLAIKRPPKTKTAPQLKDLDTGRLITGQPESLTPKSQWPMAVYTLTLPPKTIRQFERITAKTAPDASHSDMRNDYFDIEFEPKTGDIRTVFDKTTKLPLYDTDAQWGFAELIHERIARGSREKIYDIHKGMLNHESKRPRPPFIRKTAHQSNTSPRLITGPVFNSLITKGKLPNAAFQREIRIYHELPQIDIRLKIDKQIDTKYESLYLALPFAQPDSQTWIELAGAVFRAQIDQLPGSATDAHGLGRYVAVSNSCRTVILAPIECPLVQIGDINTGKWAKTLDYQNGRLYPWLMNNLWPTNFPIYQEGAGDFTWRITTHKGPFDRSAADTFSHNTAVGPVIADKELDNRFIDWAD